MTSNGTFQPLSKKLISSFHTSLGGGIALLMLCGAFLTSTTQQAAASGPRIVNVYNFVRNSDYRLADSEKILFETTRKQIELIKPTGLPATWALQYDALINTNYQKLFKEQLGTNDEIDRKSVV